jgi:hypothetical protein
MVNMVRSLGTALGTALPVLGVHLAGPEAGGRAVLTLLVVVAALAALPTPGGIRRAGVRGAGIRRAGVRPAGVRRSGARPEGARPAPRQRRDAAQPAGRGRGAADESSTAPRKAD